MAEAKNIVVRPLRPEDRTAWEALWEGYQAFYNVSLPPQTTEVTWSRLHDPAEPMRAFGAFAGARLVGIVHAILHRSCWTVGDYCYLQDLFAAPEARGRGVGRALIEAVYAFAREKGASRVYWLTHETNGEAMKLYDRIAEKSGFVQYRKAL